MRVRGGFFSSLGSGTVSLLCPKGHGSSYKWCSEGGASLSQGARGPAGAVFSEWLEEKFGFAEELEGPHFGWRQRVEMETKFILEVQAVSQREAQ